MTYQKIEAIYLLEIFLRYYTLESVVENRDEIEAVFDGEFSLSSTIPKEPKELNSKEAKSLANAWLARAIGEIYTPESLASERLNIQNLMSQISGEAPKPLETETRDILFRILNMVNTYGVSRVEKMLSDAESLGLLS